MRCHVRAGRIGVAAICLALALVTSGCPESTTEPSWQLVWQDEFDGPTGRSPDPTRWNFDVGTDWGNQQLEYDTSRPENVSLDGAGNLAIVARAESWLGSSYTSGRIHTRGHFEQAGGRFEARMKLPRGQGLWPAFWLLGANFESVGWPTCGEIDILEFRGQEPSVLHGSLHGPGYSGGNAVTRSYTVPGVTLDSDFHVYAVEWSPTRITWFVDGDSYFSVTSRDLPPGGRWVFDHPFFIILNLAVGGGFVGPPDGSTSFPQQVLVDYVRVYRPE
jgi:beta-glucanase (GH16 family)